MVWGGKYELIFTKYGQYVSCLYFNNKKDALLFQKKYGGELFKGEKKI
tara:strand:- start:12070 stop:12213 length:144 start_codon:yes stop_codon:yes gene_type:complete